MTRDQLRAAAMREQLLSTSYSFDGGLPDETYVLAVEDGAWSVYFADGGRRIDECRFETEDEACDELFLRLIEDPATRTHGLSTVELRGA